MNLARLIRLYREYWRYNEWWGILDGRHIHPLEHTFSLRCVVNVSESPLVVPAIQEAINSAQAECYRPSYAFSPLPLELVVLISEYVCPATEYTVENVENLGNMLLGLGWALPAWFWRVRLDENLFFELDKSADVYLFIGLETKA